MSHMLIDDVDDVTKNYNKKLDDVLKFFIEVEIPPKSENFFIAQSTGKMEYPQPQEIKQGSTEFEDLVKELEKQVSIFCKAVSVEEIRDKINEIEEIISNPGKNGFLISLNVFWWDEFYIHSSDYRFLQHDDAKLFLEKYAHILQQSLKQKIAEIQKIL